MLWGRPVHLQGRINEEVVLISVADSDAATERQVVGEETVQPWPVVESGGSGLCECRSQDRSLAIGSSASSHLRPGPRRPRQHTAPIPVFWKR